MKKNSIESSFKDSIASDEVIGVIKDIGELTLDGLLDDGIIKDVPILGTLHSLYKLGVGLKERHHYKKIAAFLSQLSDIPKDQRDAFLKKMDEEKDYEESTFEKILYILDRLDETAKAEITGNLFKLYVMEVISKERFYRMTSIVERAFLQDLLSLHHTYSSYVKNSDQFRLNMRNKTLEESLFGLGLMNQSIRAERYPRGILPENESGYSLEYKINNLGRDLADFMYCDLEDPAFQKRIRRY